MSAHQNSPREDPAERPAAPQINDPRFRRAVELIDAGAVQELRNWLSAHPKLVTDCAEEDGSFAGDYFRHPKLLWFVAENPIRNGSLPANIAEVARVIVEALKLAVGPGPNDEWPQQLNDTLALVCSGLVPRQSGVQESLIRELIKAGGDPNAPMLPGLAHRETEACRTLLKCGAKLSLAVAAALGDEPALNTSKRDASKAEMQAALALAAINGQNTATRILLDSGAEPNQFCPEGMHGHSTPLHQAVAANDLGTVCSLVTRGADVSIQDKLFQGTPIGWAQHFEHADLMEFFEAAAIFVPAIEAVRQGRVEELRAWLEKYSSFVNAHLGDNGRTLLHYATDWPGGLPNVGATIECLLQAGANPNLRFVSHTTEATETPLHWAASSDDLEAAEALLATPENVREPKVDLDPTGGCIADGTPLSLAVCFQNWRVAERLVEAGAIHSLPLVAGMGRMDLVQTYFDPIQGHFNNPHKSLPQRDSVSDGQKELNSALWFCSMAGRLDVARYLVERGAEVNAISPLNNTCLDEAIQKGHDQVASYLCSQGALRKAELPAS